MPFNFKFSSFGLNLYQRIITNGSKDMNNRIIFGTWQLEDDEICYKAVRDALSAGYRHIDTAADYGNEESVGRAIRESGIPREEIIVTSKLSAMVKDADEAERAMDESFRRLDLGYIDYYIIHSPRPWGTDPNEHYTAENQAIWPRMERRVRAGQFKHIGISNFDVRNVQDILDVAQIKPAVNQVKCHVGNYPRTLAAFCEKEGIMMTGYSTLSTNALIGKDAIKSFADKYGVSTAQICIRFSIQKGFYPIVLSTNPEHIASNLQVDFVISDEDMKALEALPDMRSNRFGPPQPYEGK